MGTESDPVVIAQRLLNLYRQLHIFSPEKKQEYNKMLMEQTPEVKKCLGLYRAVSLSSNIWQK